MSDGVLRRRADIHVCPGPSQAFAGEIHYPDAKKQSPVSKNQQSGQLYFSETWLKNVIKLRQRWLFLWLSRAKLTTRGHGSRAGA
jgi:hypothetical protein